MLDKLLKTKGWSSKKFAGLEALLMAFLIAIVAMIIGATSIHSWIIGAFLAYSAAALGIDAYNKVTKTKSNV